MSGGMERKAVYAGTFDPITLGHLDVLARACGIFDRVVVAVATSAGKQPWFRLEERIKLISELLPDYPRTEVCALDKLTVDFAREIGAVALVRGLRAVSDFEYEFQMAQMNRHLEQGIETIFLMPSHEQFYTSSNIVKAVAPFSRSRLAKFVPANVLAALEAKVGEKA